MSGRLSGSLGVLIAAVALAACGRTASKAGVAALDVQLPAPAQLRHATPPIALRDSTGQLIRLSQFRGRAVVLTFIYDHCADVCPLIVANLHTALEQLGPKARELQIVAVSVDPHGDTPSSVRAFLAVHDMTGRMEYLIGSYRQLAPVWKAWGVDVKGAPAVREVGHSAFLYGITGHGKVAVLYPPTFVAQWISHDAPLLAAR